jgi:hypothetical protein
MTYRRLTLPFGITQEKLPLQRLSGFWSEVAAICLLRELDSLFRSR